MDADVGVVGVGTMGSMACWQLARRGVSVLGFEQFAPGHDRSGAGGESRLFRTAYLEGAQYVPLLLEAQEQWRQLESAAGRDLLTLNGGLMIGDPDSDFLANVRACVDEYDLPYEAYDAEEAARLYPQHRLRPHETMILDRQAGFVRPELAVTMAAVACEERGGRILRRERVLAVEPDTDGVTIRTESREWRVATVVIAAGAWAERIMPAPVAGVTLQRLVMTWFPLRDSAMFTAGRFPIFIRRTGDYDISGWPCLDGASLKVAINYGYDPVDDPDRLDRGVSDDLLSTIRDAVDELLAGVIPEPVRVGAYMDGYSADNHAVVGRVDQVPNTVAMYGFSGHGFKMAPAIGRAVADLVTDGRTGLAVDHLDPGRFAAGEPSPPIRRNVATELAGS